MTTPVSSASSSYFQIPRFAKGDLEEVMRSFRPHEIMEISSERQGLDIPFFPFPGDRNGEDSLR